MLEAVMKYEIIFYVMGILAAAGVAAKIVSYTTASSLVKAAGDIQKSNQKLMKLVKAKFEHASMVSDRVQNVGAFVEKYLYEYKILGMRLDSWRSLTLKMSWLIVAMGVFGAFGSYWLEGMSEQTFRYGAVSAVLAILLVSIHILSNDGMKLSAAKNYMVEYLENVCVHRYEKANLALRAAVQPDEETNGEVNQETVEEVEPEIKEALNAKTQMKEEPKIEDKLEEAKEQCVSKEREEQEMRIRAILQEFLA